ncbi:hypothetical protein B0O99DRAFT_690847 [Bisporella sp. PMI_857]|nr:hypothetical protein B0O99DRAFT_690847 [Bisporella sp. PMI_857]
MTSSLSKNNHKPSLCQQMIEKYRPDIHSFVDIHTACVLATLQLLHSAAKEWPVTILPIFQPNVEIPGGAQAMIDDGLYEICPVPHIMLTQHVGMSKGIGSNSPECPEPIDSSGFATLACRGFHAGEPGALFTNSVNLHPETKTTNSKVRDQIFAAVKAITEAECGVFRGRVKASVSLKSRAPITLNDREIAETLQSYFGDYFGERFWTPPMDTPVEDFSILGGTSPVHFVYWKLGSTDPARWDEAEKKKGNILEYLPTNHSPEFAPAAELTVSTGIEAMTLATLIFLWFLRNS